MRLKRQELSNEQTEFSLRMMEKIMMIILLAMIYYKNCC